MTENTKTRQNAYFEMAPKEENFLVHSFRSLKCMRFVENNLAPPSFDFNIIV